MTLGLVVVLALVPASAYSQAPDDPILVVEVWSELDPLVADGGERPVPREVAIERLLEEATLVLSGMIYGFRFRYVPSYRAREIAEEFELEPYATIVRGHPQPCARARVQSSSGDCRCGAPAGGAGNWCP
jgi:hypothetical protein